MIKLKNNLPEDLAFTFREDANRQLREATADAPHVNFETIGESEAGRPITAATAGSGPLKVSLIAGNHSDEPVGPETLRLLIIHFSNLPADHELFERFTFAIVPHTNPDGEEENRPWIEKWNESGPDAASYLLHAFREKPGRDLEFGFPEMRQENAVVSSFLSGVGAFDLHMSLHGMGLSEGPMLLIERRWGFRTGGLQQGFREAVWNKGHKLHDQNRQGEKGFFYLGPGFWTTPEGAAMRDYFLAMDDPEMASKFHQSSMEFVRSLGENPLCLVTELPLFVVDGYPDSPPGKPEAYLEVKEQLPIWKRKAEDGASLQPEMKQYGIEPMPLRRAVWFQLRALELGLERIRTEKS